MCAVASEKTSTYFVVSCSYLTWILRLDYCNSVLVCFPRSTLKNTTNMQRLMLRMCASCHFTWSRLNAIIVAKEHITREHYRQPHHSSHYTVSFYWMKVRGRRAIYACQSCNNVNWNNPVQTQSNSRNLTWTRTYWTRTSRWWCAGWIAW